MNQHDYTTGRLRRSGCFLSGFPLVSGPSRADRRAPADPADLPAKIISQLSAAGHHPCHARRPWQCRPWPARLSANPLEVIEAIDGPGSLQRVRDRPEVCSMSRSVPVVQVNGATELVERLQGTAFNQPTAPNMALAQIAA